MPIFTFLDRTEELQKLETFAKVNEPSLAIIYGRRRCGKSRLLQQFARPRDLYFLADKQDPVLQRNRLAADAATQHPDFDQVSYPSWETIISQLDQRMPKGACLILDEFPYLASNNPEIPSVIQRLLDTGSLKNIHLILCGSSQRMMLNLAMGASEPLYGRSRLIIKTRPLPCGWIRNALRYDSRKSIEAYATLGGTPRYWELAKSQDSLESIIKNLILDRDGILHDEMRRLLQDDLNDSSLSLSLLGLIGNGCHRLSEFASRMGKPATQLTRPLAKLVELGYIRRETPFGENEKKSKRGLYKIADPYLAFIFRYVEPHRSHLEMGATNQIYDQICKSFPQHFGSIWEDLARESTTRIAIGGIAWKPAKRWWRRSQDGEIDAICESQDGKHILLGEAKWTATPSPKRILNQLKEKADRLAFIQGKSIHFALWSKAKAGKKGELNCISPSDILNALI